MRQIKESFNPKAFSQWLTHEQLGLIDQDFQRFLTAGNPELYQLLKQYRQNIHWQNDTDLSQFLIHISQALEDYLVLLFSLDSEVNQAKETSVKSAYEARFCQLFIKPARRFKLDPALDFECLTTTVWPSIKGDVALSQSMWVDRGIWISENYNAEDPLYQHMLAWCAFVLQHKYKPYYDTWAVFSQVKRLDYEQLIETELADDDSRQVPSAYWRIRQGFGLTDPGATASQVSSQLHYCIECHTKKTDYCRTGFYQSKSNKEDGYKVNPLGELLEGCPLDERISEMHWLKRRHWSIAALAMIMRDNPLCPLTGHRICNDCMKACIYQKQEPVDIPQIETKILKDVLAMEWGCELYDLLVRWNPLRAKQYIPKPYQYKKVLIMGMGPAGLAMAHYLLMEGCAVVGMDGLRIEPNFHLLQPIRSFEALSYPLDQRPVSGIGGVAEYGITVRWDKNFLTLAQMALLRRCHFSVYGGMRFGGTITIEEAWELGFDHVVAAVGAGLPKELPVPGSLAIGMMQANDFLMNLHLSGSLRHDVLSAIDMQMPIIVIGSGLTAVDTATESRAYYLEQIKQLLTRFEQLIEWQSMEKIFSKFSQPALTTLKVMLEHARQLRQTADQDINQLIARWGGVAIVYRKAMERSPAYRHNHQELQQALNEGIRFWECMTPIKVKIDAHGRTQALTVRDKSGVRDLPAKSILVATGSLNNIAYAYEHRQTLEHQANYYKGYALKDGQLVSQPMPQSIKHKQIPALTSYEQDGRYVSFIGDTHPVFHGSVVKAIASAMVLYPQVMQALFKHKPNYSLPYYDFYQSIRSQCQTKLLGKKELANGWVELLVHAPIHAKSYQLGNFYRLQTFETQSKRVNGLLMHSEPVALYPANVNPAAGHLTFWMQKRGASGRLLATVEDNSPISLMGPTGMRYKLANTSSQIFIFVESYWIALALSWVNAYIENGQFVRLVIHPGEYPQKQLEDRLNQFDKRLNWSYGHIMEFDWSGSITTAPTELLLLLSSDINCQLKKQIRYLTDHYSNLSVQAAIDVSMQCMLKGICAQCLTYQVDPVTQERTKAVYACSWQFQPHQWVDWATVKDRVNQNRMHEQLASIYLDYIDTCR